ncbi:MAG: glycosyltransferase, partial [Mycobacteriales bacterium]
ARQQAEATTGGRQAWAHKRESRLAERLERRIVASFDSVIAVSDQDARLLGTRVAVVPNGVDVERFSVTPLPRAARVVMTGTLGYLPNVDGIHWLVSEVWPRVRQVIPEATLELVGKDPFPTVAALEGRDGVRVIADVPEIGPYLRRARVAVVPLRIGSGTRLKALDAMAAGRPVVGTAIGLEGLNIRDGREAIVADDPESFANAVVALLRDDDLAQRLVAAGRAFVEENHDWARIGDVFAAHVIGLSGAPA